MRIKEITATLCTLALALGLAGCATTGSGSAETVSSLATEGGTEGDNLGDCPITVRPRQGGPEVNVGYNSKSGGYAAVEVMLQANEPGLSTEVYSSGNSGSTEDFPLEHGAGKVYALEVSSYNGDEDDRRVTIKLRGSADAPRTIKHVFKQDRSPSDALSVAVHLVDAKELDLWILYRNHAELVTISK